MTRDEHLKFCKKCLNRKMDMNHGLICGLTGQIANFEGECSNFNHDANVVIKPDNEEALGMSEVKAKLPKEVFEKMRLQQNLTTGIIAGLVAGLVSAILLAATMIFFELRFTFLSIGIGMSVGYAIRKLGKGVDPIFGISGAIISIFSCLLGTFFTMIGFIAEDQGLSYFQTLIRFDYSLLPDLFKEIFRISDLIFYSVAAIVGYKLSLQIITEKVIEYLRDNQ